MDQHGMTLNKERIKICQNYQKLNMLKRGIEPFVINEKIDKVIFSEKVIEGKNNQRETIIKGIELDSFKN